MRSELVCKLDEMRDGELLFVSDLPYGRVKTYASRHPGIFKTTKLPEGTLVTCVTNSSSDQNTTVSLRTKIRHRVGYIDDVETLRSILEMMNDDHTL